MTPFRINDMYAFVAIDPKDGSEGIVGKLFGETWMPFTGGDMERIDSLRPHAQQIANATGTVIRVLHFSERSEIETITPQ